MGFKIGKGSSIHLGAKFNCAKNLEIGKDCTINQHCWLDNRGRILIKDNVSISPHVKIVTADHEVKSLTFEGRNRTILIEEHCFLGVESLILGGVILSTGTIIGAKSLINKSTQPFGIYYGIPASLKGKRDENTINYSASYVRWFH